MRRAQQHTITTLWRYDIYIRIMSQEGEKVHL
jgi:hypothetical protein